jgi:hypothetical protein
MGGLVAREGLRFILLAMPEEDSMLNLIWSIFRLMLALPGLAWRAIGRGMGNWWESCYH